ncbi:hypothetical protein HIM_00684 [Hirsutella minnesotensis 3608]|nr:hypothetical protein HIM_00684 [Hirsutella minnesotensis 3608]
MQPFGRPVVRAALAHGFRLRLTDQLPRTASRVAGNKATPCLGCGRQGNLTRARLFSTKPPTEGTAAGDKQQSDSSNPSSTPLHSSPDDAPSSQPAVSELPSITDSRRSAINHRFSHVMDNLQSRVLTASSTLNDITGYSAIEAIKSENESLEAQLAAAKTRVRTARQAYKTSNTKRATTQREVTTLLARKDTWSPTDLERFTELYRTDHVLEGEVVSAQEQLNEAEAEEQSLGQRLNAGILKRYHEEQIWSDRIRRASTWGTWGLMGMNFVLFVVLQFVAEPWRRRRLVRGVVEEEKQVLQEVRSELEAVKLGLEKMAESDELRVTAPVDVQPAHDISPPPAEDAITPVIEEMPSRESWKETLLDPSRWRVVAQDLCSERRVDMRMRDASIIAAESALAGAALAGSLAWALMRRT